MAKNSGGKLLPGQVRVEKPGNIIICKECLNEVSRIVQTFNISIHSVATLTEIEATDLCLGCLGDLMQRNVFACGDC